MYFLPPTRRQSGISILIIGGMLLLLFVLPGNFLKPVQVTLATVTLPFQNLFSWAAFEMREWGDFWGSIQKLKEENELLHQEVVTLRAIQADQKNLHFACLEAAYRNFAVVGVAGQLDGDQPAAAAVAGRAVVDPRRHQPAGEVRGAAGAGLPGRAPAGGPAAGGGKEQRSAARGTGRRERDWGIRRQPADHRAGLPALSRRQAGDAGLHRPSAGRAPAHSPTRCPGLSVYLPARRARHATLRRGNGQSLCHAPAGTGKSTELRRHRPTGRPARRHRPASRSRRHTLCPGTAGTPGQPGRHLGQPRIAPVHPQLGPAPRARPPIGRVSVAALRHPIQAMRSCLEPGIRLQKRQPPDFSWKIRGLRLIRSGGEGGIRTLDTVSRIHTFQACSFNRSDTSPDLVVPVWSVEAR